MKALPAAILFCVLLMSTAILTGSALESAADRAEKTGRYCPNGATCRHEVQDQDLFDLDETFARAEHAVRRQLSAIERAVAQQAGVPFR